MSVPDANGRTGPLEMIKNLLKFWRLTPWTSLHYKDLTQSIQPAPIAESCQRVCINFLDRRRRVPNWNSRIRMTRKKSFSRGTVRFRANSVSYRLTT
jgi:hypothetical protein